MKNVKIIKEIAQCDGGKDRVYVADNGLCIRDVVIEAGIGEEIFIGHLSDLHFNYCNQEDFAQADPVVMSTYEYRLWNKDASSVPKARKCLEFLRDADFIVINGDTLDYLSHGAMELMDREVWDKYSNLIATLGGHEIAKKMQGKVEETSSYYDRLNYLKSYWRHDVYYVSRLIKNKVLIIGLLNDQAIHYEEQVQKLEADLQLAREKGYIVLIFAHEAIATKNPLHKNITEADVLEVGDPSAFPKDFYNGTTRNQKMVGSELCDEPAKAIYKLITGNADVVKGFFAGHLHNHIHLDIIAKTPSGENAVIPQYVNTATAYGDGHLMRILIK